MKSLGRILVGQLQVSELGRVPTRDPHHVRDFTMSLLRRSETSILFYVTRDMTCGMLRYRKPLTRPCFPAKAG